MDIDIVDSELVRIDIDDIIIKSRLDPLAYQVFAVIRAIFTTIGDTALDRMRLWINPQGNSNLLLYSPENMNERSRFNCAARLRNRSDRPICSITIIDKNFSVDHVKREYEVGLQLNKLRKLGIPNFLYTYYSTIACRPIIDPKSGEIYCWFGEKRSSISNAGYLLTEHISDRQTAINKTLTGVISFSQIMSLYLQGILALASAKHELELIISSINEETVVIVPAESLEDKFVIYDKLQVKIFDKLLIFSNFSTSQSEDEQIIYDVYQLSSLFLRSLNREKSSLVDPGQKLFRQFINELLEYCEIPHWYILNYDKIDFFNPKRCYKFPEETTSITYEQIIEKIAKMVVSYKLPSILVPATDKKKSTDGMILLDKVVKRKLYENDEFLNICYGSPSDEDKLPLYHQKHSICVQNIKKELESEYPVIESLRDKVSRDKCIMSREEFDDHCFTYVQLFVSLLKQKIRNDDLDCHLYTSLKVIEDIYNNKLENYINEHSSRLMRIMCEIKEFYDLTITLLPFDLQELVDRIWYILSNKSIRTK